jgi:hypothetical protein
LNSSLAEKGLRHEDLVDGAIHNDARTSIDDLAGVKQAQADLFGKGVVLAMAELEQ